VLAAGEGGLGGRQAGLAADGAVGVVAGRRHASSCQKHTNYKRASRSTITKNDMSSIWGCEIILKAVSELTRTLHTVYKVFTALKYGMPDT
jgi:hypothetical protein